MIGFEFCKLAGWAAHEVGEGFIEGAEGGVSDSHGCVGDRGGAGLEELGGAIDAEFAKGFWDGLAGFLGEDSAEGEWAAVGFGGEHFEGWRIFHVALEEIEDAGAAFAVDAVVAFTKKFRLSGEEGVGENFVNFSEDPDPAGRGWDWGTEQVSSQIQERSGKRADLEKGMHRCCRWAAEIG